MIQLRIYMVAGTRPYLMNLDIDFVVTVTSCFTWLAALYQVNCIFLFCNDIRKFVYYRGYSPALGRSHWRLLGCFDRLTQSGRQVACWGELCTLFTSCPICLIWKFTFVCRFCCLSGCMSNRRLKFISTRWLSCFASLRKCGHMINMSVSWCDYLFGWNWLYMLILITTCTYSIWGGDGSQQLVYFQA